MCAYDVAREHRGRGARIAPQSQPVSPARERGECFDVTLRGKTVAVLAPPPGRQDAVGRLAHERSAIPARLDLLDLEPLELPGGPPLTELLDEDRDDRL